MARARKNRRAVTIVPRKKNKSNQQRKQQEVTLLGRAFRALGSTAGGAIGSVFGAPIAGAQAGNSLGASISKWLGSGDYEVSQNSIVRQVRQSPQIPMMHNSSQSVVVRHKEYLGEVRSATSFTIQGFFPLNPGREDTFPWLSRIARRFQEYAFKGVVFHFVPTSGAISSTQALGSVMMQTTYRTTDSAPVSKIEMLNEYWACETVPSDALCHPIECDPKENPFNVHYVRSGDVPSTESKLSYDLGTMYIATSGQAVADIVLGDLWVTYEVELKKPVLTSDVLATADYFATSFAGGTASSFFNGTQGTDKGNLEVTFDTRTVTLPFGTFGTYYIEVVMQSTAGLSGAITWTANPTLTNCHASAIFADNAVSTQGTSATASTALTAITYLTAITKTDSSKVATILLPAATVGGGVINFFQFKIVRVD